MSFRAVSSMVMGHKQNPSNKVSDYDGGSLGGFESSPGSSMRKIGIEKLVRNRNMIRTNPAAIMGRRSKLDSKL